MLSTRSLAEFCRRAATALRAGVDVRQVFDREATIGPFAQRHQMANVRRRLDSGEALADAMAAQGHQFPALTIEMTRVGEQTGKLDRVLLQLAEHYEHLLGLRRVFLLGLIWPALQLSIALAIVGLLIWISGAFDVRNLNGQPADLIGLGLRGDRGLAIYLSLVLAFAVLLAVLIASLIRGWLWTGPLMHFLIKVPILGNSLVCLALSRMSWGLAMAIDAGMEATQSLKLGLAASQNIYFSALWPRVERTMNRRCPMSEALRETGRFPEDFLVTLETGEVTGMITETLERKAQEYRDRAQALLRMLTTIAGFACAGLVGLLIIALIFRLAMFYLGILQDAIDLTK